MAPKKKKRSCPFASSKPRQKKSKKDFDGEWAVKLAESDKGSYYDQKEWLEEKQPSADERPVVQNPVTSSASRSKIILDEPLTESDTTDKWQKLAGNALV